MPTELKLAEGVFFDYLRRSQAEKYKAEFAGTTSGSITFSDSSIFAYSSLIDLDAFIQKSQTVYNGCIDSGVTDWSRLASMVRSMIEDLLVDGQFNNDNHSSGDGITYTRKPVTALISFLEYCKTQAKEAQAVSCGGILGVINVG